MGRTITGMLSLALLVTGSAWLTRPPRPVEAKSPKVTHPLKPGRPYVVTLQAERAEFTLPFSERSGYLLVIGSLGDPGREYTVTIHTEACERLKPLVGYAMPISRRTATPRHTVARQPDNSAGSPLRGESDDKTFSLHVTDGRFDDPQQYADISTLQLAQGRHVRVLLDRRERNTVSFEKTAREIVRLFEEEILPKSRDTIGEHLDSDGDGRLTILLTPLLDRLQGGKTSLGGLVRPADFRADLTAPFSNRCDMLFLNSNVNPGPHLKALLAHEYTHVVCFSHRAAEQAIEQDWLSEGTAHVCEQMNAAGWSNLDHRVAKYLKSPQQYPLVVPDYFAAGLWRNHGCRGATFLFLQWCVDRFGTHFLQRIVRSELTGIPNVEAAADVPFEQLFREWSVTMASQSYAGGNESLNLRSVDLHAPLGRYELHGPRIQSLRVYKPIASITLRGTAIAYIELQGDNLSTVLRQINIRGDSESRLQVTLIPLPATQED